MKYFNMFYLVIVLLYSLFEGIESKTRSIDTSNRSELLLWNYCSEDADVIAAHFVPSWRDTHFYNHPATPKLQIVIVHKRKVILHSLNLVTSTATRLSGNDVVSDWTSEINYVQGLWSAPEVLCTFDVDKEVLGSVYVCNDKSMAALYLLHDNCVDVWVLPLSYQYKNSQPQRLFDTILLYEDFKFAAFLGDSHRTPQDDLVDALRSGSRYNHLQQHNASLFDHILLDSPCGCVIDAESYAGITLTANPSKAGVCGEHPLMYVKQGRGEVPAVYVSLWSEKNGQEEEKLTHEPACILQIIPNSIFELCDADEGLKVLESLNGIVEEALQMTCIGSSGVEDIMFRINSAIIALEKKSIAMENVFGHICLLLQQALLCADDTQKLDIGAGVILDICLQCRQHVAKLEHRLAFVGEMISEDVAFRCMEAQFLYLKAYRMHAILATSLSIFEVVASIDIFLKSNILSLLARKSGDVNLTSEATCEHDEEESDEDKEDVYWALCNITQCVWHTVRDVVIDRVPSLSLGSHHSCVEYNFLSGSRIRMRSTELDLSLATALLVYINAFATCKVLKSFGVFAPN